MVSGQKGFSSIVEELINIFSVFSVVGWVVIHVDAVSQIVFANLGVGVNTSVVV
jgi:hypothetical protein